MIIKRIDATISTNKLTESRDFYIKHFGFELVYESDWYIELLSPSLAAGVSFTLPQRDVGEFFTGKGLILSFGVDNVDAEYERLNGEGLTIQQELQNKPWGERSFVVNDPNGVHIYVYTLIPPEPEYQVIYDKYKK
ncbi:glyoxalase [Anaerosporomusa subterranea]|uniref:Glyoxalase n=1 Tax=Anaerosporomusa subterranea TaxID=1794912 RepID=A0A154BQE6_ANASB|nr:VOC family protein [Anaerosporomusa subterranea]KYZ76214.1 glyoxalase [Anaerosporomusa subterranea]